MGNVGNNGNNGQERTGLHAYCHTQGYIAGSSNFQDIESDIIGASVCTFSSELSISYGVGHNLGVQHRIGISSGDSYDYKFINDGRHERITNIVNQMSSKTRDLLYSPQLVTRKGQKLYFQSMLSYYESMYGQFIESSRIALMNIEMQLKQLTKLFLFKEKIHLIYLELEKVLYHLVYILS